MIQIIKEFKKYLIEEEKSEATIEKYIRDVSHFFEYKQNEEISKELVMNYKTYLIETKYKTTSINSMLASINCFLDFSNQEECKVKCLKQQRKIFSPEEKELTKEEYFRLLEASKQDEQMQLIMQTICSTGIRVSELNYFTVEGIQKGVINIRCKGKERTILIPNKLKKILLKYIKKQNIKEGYIFLTKKGKPVNRTMIWQKMKKLCKSAKVNPNKVFPHNLRKLFARLFYKLDKDIAKLADILGHSNMNTTRIYIMSTGHEHRKRIDQLGLVLSKKILT